MSFPFRMCWAITCHKSQGMTVGPGKQVELAEVNLGPNDTDSWVAGSALVELSRVTEIGALMVDSVASGFVEIHFKVEGKAGFCK